MFTIEELKLIKSRLNESTPRNDYPALTPDINALLEKIDSLLQQHEIESSGNVTLSTDDLVDLLKKKYPGTKPVMQVEGRWVPITGIRYVDKNREEITFQLCNV